MQFLEYGLLLKLLINHDIDNCLHLILFRLFEIYFGSSIIALFLITYISGRISLSRIGMSCSVLDIAIVHCGI